MSRPAFVLVFALLIVVALELAMVATLTLATHERGAVAAQERSAQAQRQADNALRRLIRAWPHPAAASLAIAQSTAYQDSAGVTLTLQRLSAGQILATAIDPAQRGRVRSSVLLETIDIGRALAEASGAIVSDTITAAPTTLFLTDSAKCIRPPTPAPGFDGAQGPPAGYAFAGLDWQELASIADSQFVFIPASYTLPSGSHDLVLVVRGDLLIPGDAAFTGVAVVGGTLRLDDGAQVHGSVIVRGGHADVSGATVTFAPCAVLSALNRSPAVHRLARSRRRFLPAF